LPRVSTIAEYVEQLLPELETMAPVNGGVGQILHDKWRRVYKMSAPRGRFGRGAPQL
jgi:hypothetical protein